MKVETDKKTLRKFIQVECGSCGWKSSHFTPEQEGEAQNLRKDHAVNHPDCEPALVRVVPVVWKVLETFGTPVVGNEECARLWKNAIARANIVLKRSMRNSPLLLSEDNFSDEVVAGMATQQPIITFQPLSLARYITCRKDVAELVFRFLEAAQKTGSLVYVRQVHAADTVLGSMLAPFLTETPTPFIASCAKAGINNLLNTYPLFGTRITEVPLEVEHSEVLLHLEHLESVPPDLREHTIRLLSSRADGTTALRNVLTVLDEAVAEAQTLGEHPKLKHVEAAALRTVGISTESDKGKIARIEESLQARVVGQDFAISSVARCIRTYAAGLKDDNKPIGSFVFLGPSGVGKTELARTIAAFLFGDERALIRMDMSEYKEEHSLARLFGAPPGYVGYDEGGQLTEAVRRKPYSVVLLDEIEKAARSNYDALLQVLDDGRLTDGKGKVTDFRNVILIMTSNLASTEVTALLQKGDKEGAVAAATRALWGHFRVEFLNRIDEVILFNLLTPELLHKIADLQLAPLKQKLLHKGVDLHVSKRAYARLVEQGYSIDMGARPLQRIVRGEVSGAIAAALASNEKAQELNLDAVSNGFRVEAR